MTLYVNYGCGQTAPDGWRNFDVSPRLRAERAPLIGALMRGANKNIYPTSVEYGDIVAGLPIADGSADAVFCSHVLEHIDRAGVKAALANTLRILKPSGIFRLIVPDLEWRARRYVEQVAAGESGAADKFIRSAYIGEERGPATALDRVRLAWGNSNHRWMYDYHAMAALLKDTGFMDVRRAEIGDAELDAFDAVERQDRFFDEGFPELAMEARKA